VLDIDAMSARDDTQWVFKGMSCLPPEHRQCLVRLSPGGGDAVITKGHDLAAPWVVHCLGPVYGRDDPAADLLASCHREALRLADDAGATSIAFPAISTGAFGYPIDEAAPVAVRAVRDALPDLASIELVRFVLFGEDDLEAFQRALDDAG